MTRTPPGKAAERDEMNAIKYDRIRRLTHQSSDQEAAFVVPDTEHWADWHDADAVAYHGREIAAWHPDMGAWVDSGCEPVEAALSAAIEAAPHVGISTRR
jgi:hypothetical protein